MHRSKKFSVLPWNFGLILQYYNQLYISYKMRYGKLQANLSGQRSESGNLATFTLSITSTVRRPNFQTPVLSQGATIWANVSDMVNLESVEHPQPHFMKINFLAFIVILPYSSLSYNTVCRSLSWYPFLWIRIGNGEKLRYTQAEQARHSVVR